MKKLLLIALILTPLLAYGQGIVLMEQKTDCEVSAIGTACGVNYDTAETALGWRKLPLGAENPIFGNPLNLYRSLIKLGFWKMNVTLTMLLEGKVEPIKTIVLIHDPENPLLNQHWCNWAGIDASGNHLLLDGRSATQRVVNPEHFKELFRRGAPNCAFQVYKANFFTLMWNRFLLYIRN